MEKQMKPMYRIIKAVLFLFLTSTAWAQNIKINEISAANATIQTDEDGDYSDWIELYNPTSQTVDLAGFYLSDDFNQPQKWIFPTIQIKPAAFLIIWLSGKNRTLTLPLHTNYKLDKSGETISLYAKNGTVLDRATFVNQEDDITCGRFPDGGEWKEKLRPTPSSSNALLPDSYYILINEVLADNDASAADEDGDHSDWIEVLNTSNKAINLINFSLSDDNNAPRKWLFPSVTIQPYSFIMIWASGKNRSTGGALHTNFTIDKTGDHIWLYGSDQKLVSEITFTEQLADVSYGRFPDGDKTLYPLDPTPASANRLALQNPGLYINEIMAENKTGAKDQDGTNSDWLEIYNASDQTLNLAGYTLTDDFDNPQQWTFPDIPLPAKSFLVVWASGKDRLNPAELHTNFKLSTSGEQVGLYTPQRKVVDEITFGPQTADVTLGRYFDGQGTLFYLQPSPGSANQPLTKPSNILINELLASNGTTKTDQDGDFSDWIELYNRGTEAVNLQGFGLTDQLDPGTKWILPSLILPPQGYVLIWASGKDKVGAELHTNFKLSADVEQILLFNSQNELIDIILYQSQKSDIAYGRFPDGQEWQAGLQPTPGAANRMIIAFPQFSLEQGFYNTAISVTLSTSLAGAVIRYTTNGAAVNKNSPIASKPISISQTTALRAAVFPNNNSQGPTATKTYFINERVIPPVMSVVTDPANLDDPVIGINVNWSEEGEEWERPISASFFESDKSLAFEIPAGIRVHGLSSRRYLKKSYRLYFRSEYGQSRLDYQLFPRTNVQIFDRLVLHASQDQMFYYGKWTMLRNSLITTLCRGTAALAPESREIALYINGKFWGIYNLREHLDEEFVERHFGISKMDMLKANTNFDQEIVEGTDQHFKELYAFLESHPLAHPDSFQQAVSYLDLDNFTDYVIIGAFSGDRDWPHNNYYAFRPAVANGRWRWIFWDNDHGFANFWKEDVNINSIEWITRDAPVNAINRWSSDKANYIWATLLLRKLLENPTYTNIFLNRFADMLNSGLAENTTIAKLDSLANGIRGNVALEQQKWQGWAHGFFKNEWGPVCDVSFWDLNDWEKNITFLQDFLKQRPNVVRKNIVDKFKLAGTARLTVDISGSPGSVRVNALAPSQFPWTGVYFQGVPVILKAIPAGDDVFIKWTDPALPEKDSVAVSLTSDKTIAAVFRNPYEAVLSVTEPSLNFSTIGLNTKRFKTFVVKNAGKSLLKITGMQIANDPGHEFKILNPTTQFDLPFNTAQTIYVEYLPTAISEKRADLVISSNDIHQTTYTVVLAASKPVDEDFTTGRMDGYTNHLPASGPMFNQTVRTGHLRLTLPNTNKFNHYATGDFAPQLLRTIDSKDWIIETKIDSLFTSDKDFMTGLIVRFSQYDLIYWGLNSGKNLLSVQRTGGDEDKIPFSGQMPVRLRIRKTGATYFFEYNTGTATDWIVAASKNETIEPPAVGLIGRTWTKMNMLVDFDYLYLNHENQTSSVVPIEMAELCATRLANDEVDLMWRTLSETNNLGFAVERAFQPDRGWQQIGFVTGQGTTSVPAIYHFTDHPGPAPVLYYRLKQVDTNGETSYSSVVTVHSKVPQQYALAQNWPNPFNPTTVIEYHVAKPADIRIEIFNLLGEKVKTLVQEKKDSGAFRVLWDGTDDSGNKVSAGIYLYKMEAERFIQIKKLTLLK